MFLLKFKLCLHTYINLSRLFYCVVIFIRCRSWFCFPAPFCRSAG